jgi:hypothetical protein
MAKGVMYLATLVGVVMFEPINQSFGASGALIATGASGLLMMAYILLDRTPFSERMQARPSDATTS